MADESFQDSFHDMYPAAEVLKEKIESGEQDRSVSSSLENRVFSSDLPTSGELHLNIPKWEQSARSPTLRIAGFSIVLLCRRYVDAPANDKERAHPCVAIVVDDIPLNAVRGFRLGLSFRQDEKSPFTFHEFDESSWVHGRVVSKVKEGKPLDITCEVRAQVLGIPDAKETFNFFDPFPNKLHLSDVIVFVEGVRLHLSKAALAVHCEFFDKQFFGEDWKDQDEVRLSELFLIDFVTFLYAIYPPRIKLDETNVEAILAMADRFIVPYLVKDAEDYLIKMQQEGLFKDKTFTDKLQLSELYRLRRLTAVLVESATAEDIHNTCMKEELMKSLSSETTKLLLKKSSSFLDSSFKTSKRSKK